MKIVYKFLTLLALLLSHNAYALDRGGSPASQQDTANSKITCPATDYSMFAAAFSVNTSIQKKFTKTPLKWVVLIDPTSDPKPLFSTRFLKRNQISFPVILSNAELIGYGLVTNTKKLSKETFVIIESSAGDRNLGHYVQYIFRYINNCWFLVEIADEST